MNFNQKGTAITETCCILALIAIAAFSSLGYLGETTKDTFEISAKALNLNTSGTRNEEAKAEQPARSKH